MRAEGDVSYQDIMPAVWFIGSCCEIEILKLINNTKSQTCADDKSVK